MQKSICWEANIPTDIKEIPRVLYNSMFITAFTKSRHLYLFSARSIHSTSSQMISLISTLILPFHLSLGLQSDLFTWVFPAKTLYAFLFSPTRTCPLHFIRLDFITGIIIFCEDVIISDNSHAFFTHKFRVAAGSAALAAITVRRQSESTRFSSLLTDTRYVWVKGADRKWQQQLSDEMISYIWCHFQVFTELG